VYGKLPHKSNLPDIRLEAHKKAHCHSDDSRSEGGRICCRQAASVLRADSRFLNGFAGSE
jgi:hypothetical protein